MKRLLALLLAVVMVASLCTGCDLEDIIALFTDGGQFGGTDAEVNPHLHFKLDQQMLDAFYEEMDRVEAMAIEGTDIEAIDAASDQLEELYMDIVDQIQIAQVLQSMDVEDEALSEQYLTAVDKGVQLETDYNAMTRRVYNSDSAAKETLFEDWTQDEIDRMLAHNVEIASLEKRNEELTVEYRELSEESLDWGQEVVRIYNEMVKNCNRIAELYGYENYYEYASRVIYERDFGAEERSKMRSYATTYLMDATYGALDTFLAQYEALSFTDSNMILELMYTDYCDLDTDYVGEYIQQIPMEAADVMNGMVLEERVVFADGSNALEGAFTTYIDGGPFCFFGPGYQNCTTLVHELGHYYGGTMVELWEQPMDISEVQSQGNEWLFVHYLSKTLSEELFECFLHLTITDNMTIILSALMIDQFEEMVYTHPNAGELTLEEYEALMDEVVSQYGDPEEINYVIGDLNTYWKMVVVEQPVYYISYAVSAVAAMDIYVTATENEEQAWTAYRALVEEMDPDAGFLKNLENAGIDGPFEEDVYAYFANLYTN